MLNSSQEIIGAFRIKEEYMYQIACDLADASKAVHPSLRYRTGLNIDLVNTQVSAPRYVMEHMVPKINDEGNLNVWTGILIEHQAGRNPLPKVLGAVCVRPDVAIELNDNTNSDKNIVATTVDAWSSAKNHDGSLAALFSVGREVAARLFSEQPVVTVESVAGNKYRKPKTPPTFDAIVEVFPSQIYSGRIQRPDPARTLIRDGRRRGMGILFGAQSNSD